MEKLNIVGKRSGEGFVAHKAMLVSALPRAIADRVILMVSAAREHGVSPATIHRWKSKYGGMTLSELKRLKALEEENARLKRIIAQQALDNELLKEINAKNGKPSCPKVNSEVSGKTKEELPETCLCSCRAIQIPSELHCQASER